ncbi:hypothetical protein BK809_0000307 [Diplodia seriata]|uniref:Heterokaryon incompatibility domain-containing protein n=1 Tax=Diplodia seriata TaxID=420778 RepID=A0A1S8B9T6_9PEZI|nr:hypothetical protein BK809_0000307 [Diplodia seriata]
MLRSTGARPAYATIKKWLQKCQSSHGDCNKAPSDSRRPTRLLDLDAFPTSSDIKLVSGADTGTGQYATLSYCWGGVNPVMLRTSNIKDFRARIQWSTLPQTMKDAVTVCRNLDVRYLWIDALCIIQGDDGDFNTEAPRMEAVYAGSAFTVAAAHSKNSEGGCFREVSPLGRSDSLISQDNNYTVLLKARSFCTAFENIPGHCPLDSRGWVFQERMLSPRTLFFGRDEIHWECRKGVICAYEPDFEKPHFPAWLSYTPIKHNYTKVRSLEKAPSPNDAIRQFQRLWVSVIEAYSRTNLSFAQDKLAAIAGLASIAQQKLNIEASFGLWLPFLLDDLLWEVEPPQPEQDDSRTEPTENQNCVSVSLAGTPSWSWASTNAKISFLHEPQSTAGKPIGDVEEQHSATVSSFPPPTPFIGLHTLVSQQPTPPSVRVRGLVSKCRALPYQAEFGLCGFDLQPDRPISEAERPKRYARLERAPPLTHTFAKHHNNVVQRGRFACVFQPDLPINKPMDDLMCVLIKRVRYKPEGKSVTVRDVGLVLQPTGGKATQYRRVGIYTEERSNQNTLPMFMFLSSVEEKEMEIL